MLELRRSTLTRRDRARIVALMPVLADLGLKLPADSVSADVGVFLDRLLTAATAARGALRSKLRADAVRPMRTARQFSSDSARPRSAVPASRSARSDEVPFEVPTTMTKDLAARVVDSQSDAGLPWLSRKAVG
jgi:hypothetical protein